MADAPVAAQAFPHDDARSKKIARLWAGSMLAIVVMILTIVVFSSVHLGLNPPSQLETVDSASLHRGGEFAEANLGTMIAADGSALVRVIAQQYAWVPSCVLVPAGVPVTMRLASADVVHGFLIQDTNVNAMVVPGYITTVHTRFREAGERLMPCHEFCGIGHQAMWAHVKVVDANRFPSEEARTQGVSCAR